MPLVNGGIPEVRRTTLKTSTISSLVIPSSFMPLIICFLVAVSSDLEALIPMAISFWVALQ